MRRMLSHTLDAVKKLVPASEPTAPLYQDLRENAESMHFYADELLEDVNNLLSIQLALASHRTNEVVRVLTVFSVFFLPLTFIVGIYGMNFHVHARAPRALGLSRGDGSHGGRDPGDLSLVPRPGLAAGMMESLALVLVALAGRRCSAGCWAAGRAPPACAPAVAPHLLPDPALEWLRRAHRAIGVWITELDPAEEGPRAERIVEPERLSVAQIVAVDRRLNGHGIRSRAESSGWKAGCWSFMPRVAPRSDCCSRELRALAGSPGWRTTCDVCSRACVAGRISSR